MAYVNPATQSIKTCFQGRYSLPYFQREYKWEPRHYGELVTDIQESFLLTFEENHGRTEVSTYQPYFLGSIITSSEVEGKKPLIDGQQRLTSTFLLLAYLERHRRDGGVKDAVDLSNLLGSVSYGVTDYSIEFSNSRKSLFDAYLSRDLAMAAALEAAEDVQHLDDGDRRLLEALRDTDSLLDDVVKAHMAHFIDYVVERVLLIDISVATEAEAHRVFVTMNDRGLRLGPIDLLKGQILSNIPSPQLSQQAHSSWVDSTTKLRALGAEEDSLFFRTLFRAKWANSIRGKSKGDAPGDFDVIGDEYHRWFSDNLHKIGIKNSDDYFRFVAADIPKYVEVYAFVKEVESKLTPGYEAFFFNASRKFSSAYLISLAVVNVGDTSAQWKEKINLLARFVDLLLSVRSIELKQNNYENLRHIVFALAKALRGKSYAELLEYVRAEWPKYSVLLPKMADLTYSSSEKDVLFLLARIAHHLEAALELKTKTGFVTFLKRDRNLRTFDIEHILKKNFDVSTMCVGHGFDDVKEYAQQRDTLGGLILLPRSRNRSLSDDSYSKKLCAYATENVLAQTLTSNFYVNNPVIGKLAVTCPSIALAPAPGFGKAEIAARAKLYVETARIIWASP